MRKDILDAKARGPVRRGIEMLAMAAVGVALIVGAGTWLSACQNPPEAPSPVTIINTNTATNNQGQNPGSSPSPGTGGGTLPPGSTVRVGFFGFSGANCTLPNGARQIKAGCVGFATCTPKDPQGVDLPAAVHGPDATWTVPFGSERISLSRDANPFNVDVRALSVGTFRLECKVKDITGGADFEVIAASSSSEGATPMADGWPFPPAPCACGNEGCVCDAEWIALPNGMHAHSGDMVCPKKG